LKRAYSARPVLLAAILALMASLGCLTYEKYYDLDKRGKALFDEIRYIATDEELKEFLALSPKKRAAWLQHFWEIRDPTPGTPINEFKIEHYRRLRYVAKEFRWGKTPGWKTDRGRVFIKYGPPTSIERHPIGDVPLMGGWYSKPYEIWWYDYIPNVATDVKLLFVDEHMTGEYVLKTSLAEAASTPLAIVQSSRFDRVTSSGPQEGIYEGKGRGTTKMAQSVVDVEKGVVDPFKQTVPITMGDASLDLILGVLTFAGSGRRNLVEFDFVVPNSQLEFVPDQGGFKAELIISTRLYDSKRQLVGGTLRRRFAFASSEEETVLPDKFFTYIAGALLAPGVYEIEAVVKDVASGRYGYLKQRFEVKLIDPLHLSLSSVELAHQIRPATKFTLFVKHGFEVMPNPAGVYRLGGVLSVYYEIYNLTIGLDGKPKFMIQYSVSKRGDPEAPIVKYKFLAPQKGGSNQVQVYRLPLRPDLIGPGEYTLYIRVVDVLAGMELSAHRDFEVVD